MFPNSKGSLPMTRLNKMTPNANISHCKASYGVDLELLKHSNI